MRTMYLRRVRALLVFAMLGVACGGAQKLAQQCEKGSATGCYLYAQNLLSGMGIDKDVAKGNAMLEKACKLGEKKVCVKGR